MNDLLIFHAATYGPYILSGYDNGVNPFIFLDKLLSECSEEELSMLFANIWDYPCFYFVKSPDQKEEHTITVRIQADYGEPVRTARIQCIPVWRH